MICHSYEVLVKCFLQKTYPLYFTICLRFILSLFGPHIFEIPLPATSLRKGILFHAEKDKFELNVLESEDRKVEGNFFLILEI